MSIEMKFAPVLNLAAAKVMNFRPKYFDKTQARRNWYANVFFGTKWNIKHFIDHRIIATLAKMQSVFKVRQMPSFPAGDNLFHHDSYCMGTYIGHNDDKLCVMYDHSAAFVILYHKESGQRIRVDIKQPKEKDAKTDL